MNIHELTTPALLADAEALEHNLATMAEALPGPRCRPHVKAHKSTALARLQAEAGHRHFTCATTREVEGMAAAGLGTDLLLANEVVDVARLERLARLDDARVTVAVDSDATVEAAAATGIREVVVDVNIGLPRCGCDPADAGRLADVARSRGLAVRGVMGYEGHVVVDPSREARERGTKEAMEKLVAAHGDVGGDIVSAGGTGNYHLNTWATEIQAGSYVLVDSAYGSYEDLPFRPGLWVLATVIHVNDTWAVADAGLKALAMDHGDPALEAGDGDVWFYSDEHATFSPGRAMQVGDRVRVRPAHIDPTIAKHDQMHVVRGDEVVDTLPVDLRGW